MDFRTFLLRAGRNIRKARWRKGLTQQQVAAEGFTYRYLQEIERGTRNPSLKMLFDLAGVLDVRVGDLLDVGERRAPVKLADVSDAMAPKRGRKPSTKKRSRRG